MTRVEIYTKSYCSYCVRAKQLLERKGAVYAEYEVGQDSRKHAEMLQRAPGARTVPQIFIGDRHIGGADELIALDRLGDLDTLLAG